MSMILLLFFLKNLYILVELMSRSVYSLLQTINKVKEVVPQEDGQYLE